eukprot:jgi/Ulvmu1/12772/UM096_0014.1
MPSVKFETLLQQDLLTIQASTSESNLQSVQTSRVLPGKDARSPAIVSLHVLVEGREHVVECKVLMMPGSSVIDSVSMAPARPGAAGPRPPMSNLDVRVTLTDQSGSLLDMHNLRVSDATADAENHSPAATERDCNGRAHGNANRQRAGAQPSAAMQELKHMIRTIGSSKAAPHGSRQQKARSRGTHNAQEEPLPAVLWNAAGMPEVHHTSVANEHPARSPDSRSEEHARLTPTPDLRRAPAQHSMRDQLAENDLVVGTLESGSEDDDELMLHHGVEQLGTVLIKTLTGTIHTLQVCVTATVLQLKQAFCDQEGVPVDEQRLICAGRQLEDGWSVRPLCNEGVVIHLAKRLRGC